MEENEEKSEKIVVTNFGNAVDNVLNQNFGISSSFEHHVDYEVVDISGKKIMVVGAGAELAATRTTLMHLAKENSCEMIVVDNMAEKQNSLFDVPRLKEIDFPMIEAYDPDVPNKLQMLRKLNLSPEEIKEILNSPENRMNGEDFDKYKKRKSIKKLLIKYRGQI